MTVRKQDDQIMRGVRLLAKKECAYYDSGVCLCNERPCHVLHPTYKMVHDGAIDCDFFLHAVLPAQPELNAAVWHEVFQEEGCAGDGGKCAPAAIGPLFRAAIGNGTAPGAAKRRRTRESGRSSAGTAQGRNTGDKRYLLEAKKARENKHFQAHHLSGTINSPTRLQNTV